MVKRKREREGERERKRECSRERERERNEIHRPADDFISSNNKNTSRLDSGVRHRPVSNKQWILHYYVSHHKGK